MAEVAILEFSDELFDNNSKNEKFVKILKAEKCISIKLPINMTTGDDMRKPVDGEVFEFRDCSLDTDLAAGTKFFKVKLVKTRKNSTKKRSVLIVEVDIDSKVPGTGPEDKKVPRNK